MRRVQPRLLSARDYMLAGKAGLNSSVCRCSTIERKSRTIFQTVETVVRSLKHSLDADKFPMFSVG